MLCRSLLRHHSTEDGSSVKRILHFWLVTCPEGVKTKYPLPGKKDEYYEWRMDMSTLQNFHERDFMEALSYIGVIPE